MYNRASSRAPRLDPAGRCMAREKHSFSILANLNITFFSTNSKLKVHNICVKFYFSRVCRTNKNFQSFIILLLKISFFANFFLFSLHHLKLQIFIPSMKFSLNYHEQNFIYTFFYKMTVKYLFEWKTIKKKEILKNIQIVFSKTKYFT